MLLKVKMKIDPTHDACHTCYCSGHIICTKYNFSASLNTSYLKFIDIFSVDILDFFVGLEAISRQDKTSVPETYHKQEADCKGFCYGGKFQVGMLMLILKY